MNDDLNRRTSRLGLLASAAAHRWELAVDEALDRNDWSLEVEGPQIYLVFQLEDLRALPAALRFLESGPDGEGTLTLGRFGSASVSLLWDNEDFRRCFLVVGPKARSTLRVSLGAEDIDMVIQALRRLLKQIPQGYGE
jgi:hypothetical protein